MERIVKQNRCAKCCFMKRFSALAVLVSACVLALLPAGCQRKMKPEEIFNEQKSGVVLIMNAYYYELTMPNGERLYFTGVDEQNGGFTGLTNEKAEVLENRNVLNGTGFFISHKGDILTNRHVVAPIVDKALVKQNYHALLRNYGAYLTGLQEQMAEKYAAIRQYAAEHAYYDGNGNLYTDMSDRDMLTLSQEAENLKQQYREAEAMKQGIVNNLLSGDFSVRCVAEYGIAYDNSYVGTELKAMERDFMQRNPCMPVKESAAPDTDLALLRLKSGKTPDDKFVFEIPAEDDAEALEVNQTLYMIGYNAGIILANTRKGVAAQLTSGTVTQTPDGDRLLYSIPTMQGSSGSPVIDAYGRVVAVNFAKMAASDNFNFGVPLNKVRKFLKE